MKYPELLLLLLVISSINVLYFDNSIFSLISLVFSFIVTAFILMSLECELLAFLFIIIYVGAVMILFLFAIMMLPSKSMNQSENAFKYLPIGLFFCLLLLTPILKHFFYQFNKINISNATFYVNNYQNWYDLTDSISDVELYGKIVYSYFLIEVLILGLILLLVLIGVVHLTKSRKTVNLKQARGQSNCKQLARKSKLFG